MRGLFVTGTDTNIGKTVVSAALMHRLRPRADLVYWKPIQTGFPGDDDTAMVRTLGDCRSDEICADGIRLPEPLSPHLAARHAGTCIEMEELLSALPSQTGARAWIVEGAGGVLVPIDGRSFMVDLMARSGLGTINHTLLTLEVLRSRSLRIAGVVLVGEGNPENAESIEDFGAVEILGQLPHLHPGGPMGALTCESLAAWACSHLDRKGLLENLLCKDAL
jgi:dethiobiotin synthase